MAQVTLPYTLTPGQPENVTQLTDNLNALVAGVNSVNTSQLASSVGNFGGWTSWTPTLYSDASVTLGAGGSSAGQYVQIGKTVFAQFKFTWGGAGRDVGSGNYSINVPVTAVNTTYVANGLAHCADISPNPDNLYFCQTILTSTTRFQMITSSSFGGGVLTIAAINPVTWDNGDVFTGCLTYEAA